MLKMAVLVSGGGTNLQAIIDRIADGSLKNAEITVVISNNKNAFALERARKNQIETVCISPKNFAQREDFNRELLATIQSYQVDLVVMAGCLVTIPDSMVEAYRNRIINVHPALIPAFAGTGYYGLKVHEAALKRGVKLAGATVHFVDEITDNGPIISQRAVAVAPDDTPETLQHRVMEEAEWQLLPEAIGMIAAGRIRVEGNRVMIAEERT